MEVANTNQSAVVVQQTGIASLSKFLNSDGIKSKFTEILGSKGPGFIASVLSAISQNEQLKDADQNSIYTCCLMAASLDLPINPNLGMAYLIPYNQKIQGGGYKKVCQFQIGYKGLKQLAQRSGQFKILSDAIVYDGQLIEQNPLTGFKFDWTKKKSEKVIGFVSYFELSNGFTSTLYMSVEEVKKHGAKYSKTFSNQLGVWNTEFESMALKTVTKLNLSRNAPLSVEMQRATIADQMVIKEIDNSGNIKGEYIDVTPQSINPEEIAEEKEYLRISEHIENSKTIEELKLVEQLLKDNNQIISYEDKKKEIEKFEKGKK